MIRALVFMLGCSGGLSPSETADGGVAIAAAPTLRNCLKIAGGLKDSGDGAAASAQVLSCYDDHFLPMLPIVRDQNRRAALSLEYGFGLLAHCLDNGSGIRPPSVPICLVLFCERVGREK